MAAFSWVSTYARQMDLLSLPGVSTFVLAPASVSYGDRCAKDRWLSDLVVCAQCSYAMPSFAEVPKITYQLQDCNRLAAVLSAAVV